MPSSVGYDRTLTRAPGGGKLRPWQPERTVGLLGPWRAHQQRGDGKRRDTLQQRPLRSHVTLEWRGNEFPLDLGCQHGLEIGGGQQRGIGNRRNGIASWPGLFVGLTAFVPRTHHLVQGAQIKLEKAQSSLS